MTKRQRIEEALADKYEFRCNVLTGTIEFRLKNQAKYQNHTDYHMNTIIREIDRERGESVSPNMYQSIVMSDFSERYHPIRFYFEKFISELDRSTDTENIKKLAQTVTVPNPEAWELSLKRWLIASVANGLNDKDCQNHTCIVLTGGMGLFKTTWLMNLCPPMLSPDMAFTGKIDLNLTNKDTFTMLGTKFIMNLDDQLRNLMKKDSETMKTIITHPEISIRRPYTKFSETIPRIANFLASINGDEFLAENENRRFLPFRVSAIDINQAQRIDMNLVWNEAYSIYLKGLELQKLGKNGNEEAKEVFEKEFRYWWTKAELEEAFPDMQSFAYASDELEMITSYFDIPETKERANVTMTATDVASFLKAKTGGLVPSTKKIGEALKTLKAIQFSVRHNGTPVKKYALIDKSSTAEPLEKQPDSPYSKPKKVPF